MAIAAALLSSGAGRRDSSAAQKSLSLGFQLQHSDVDTIATDALDASDAFQGMSLGLAGRFHWVFEMGLSLGLRGAVGATAPGSYVLAPQIGYVLDGRTAKFELTAEGGLHGFSGFGPGFPALFTTVTHDPVATVPFVGGGMSMTGSGRRGGGLVAFVGRDLREKRVTAQWQVLTASRSGEYEVGGWFFGLAINAVWEVGGANRHPRK